MAIEHDHNVEHTIASFNKIDYIVTLMFDLSIRRICVPEKLD